MRTIHTSIHYVPPFNYSTTFTKSQMMYTSNPAHWAVDVEISVDDNPMSASVHQYAFASKPTAKQVRQCKRKAVIEHVHDLAKFIEDYPHFFK